MISSKFLVSTAAAMAVIGAAGFAFAQSTPGGTTESPTATPPLQSQPVTPTVTPGNPSTTPTAPAADSAAPASPSGTMGSTGTGSSGTMGSTGTSGTTGSSGVITERPAQADRN